MNNAGNRVRVHKTLDMEGQLKLKTKHNTKLNNLKTFLGVISTCAVEFFGFLKKNCMTFSVKSVVCWLFCPRDVLPTLVGLLQVPR